ncbi:LuxR C-terminal-related transcriptional regulator [Microbacterium sp. W1N]|uniref:helix-turn-helix transcriptional regulator n=1 Tax=Microbacterium festucae TaxID=2977531 RepID=UPI0021BE291D|nr:LuxR C-terminal-related transcriptional regulator [Microbacterium festucae]MCT9818965.1 LuxR C-terminal-related transcriptional regulator [Microbacterium festucae]
MTTRSTTPTTLTALGAPPPAIGGPGEEVARMLADTAAAGLGAAALPIRGVVIGAAGSGKTLTLQALRRELAARDIAVRTLAGGARAGGTPAPDDGAADAGVLLVDDAHTLDDDGIAALLALAADPEASLVVAYRDHPASDPLRRLGGRLERSAPPVLLGEITADRIAEATQVSVACAHAIVRRTGGLTWLTLAALDAHDSGTCDLDPAHRDLARTLRSAIAHRLDQVDRAARPAVEALCLFPPAEIAALEAPGVSWEEAIAHGSAAGLLRPNGEPPSIVRAAVRAVLPVHRLTELLALAHHDSADGGDDWDDDAWDDDAVSGGAPGRLIRRGDALRVDDPARALSLYREALVAGAEPADLAVRFGIAAFADGDLDTAAAAFDRVLRRPGHPGLADALDGSAAIWSARGTLAVGAAAARTSPTTATSAARAALIDLGVGRRPQPAPPAAVPDTATVAGEALTAAVRTSFGTDLAGAVDDLVLASELASATRSDFPLVEPPAVVAAAAAMSTGSLAVAASVLASAVEAGQCGRWGRPRLRLWQAWVSIAAARPDEARTHLAAAQGGAAALQPRDRLIAAVCETALARRYANTATLMAVFRDARPHLLRQRFDAYLLPFLGELLLAAVRVGAADAAERHFDAAMAGLDAAGAPPLWAPLPHWAGIQRGILQGQPDALVPHARALLAAAEHSPFAARLADAGRIWTDVLAGKVDTAQVERAAHALARDGLAWDGARLAAHGAARTGDKQSAAQLLACARELHPTQLLATEATHADAAPTADGTALSARELEVARLVVQGRTYVEIGQTLFISPRTAEHHIARIRRRLDAESRSDLLTKLRDVLRGDAPHGREGAA